ncbi:TPR-like protein [Tilletiaria anomala UBC 951]|uniref:TPR-like protein n=1 Tax=Tilletiaria anomala (strain ATCC 24038 / CBS 436.72 / UBC 951) TaxID=1037660 RepID=A0A066VYP2_TILAU|nr:TPR-like protein [Tilletiaria anomala UBC 951]KDN46621.1 TPR-like protein [Tilletiaria anomala UBC 951]
MDDQIESLWAWTASLPGASADSGVGGTAQTLALLTHCKAGDYAAVLRSEAAQIMLQPFKEDVLGRNVSSTSSPSSSARRYELDKTSLIHVPTSDEEFQQAILITAAALSAFIQANWTGPDLSFSSAELLGIQDKDAKAQLHSAAVDALQWRGEPAYHLCRDPFMLVFAVRWLAKLSLSPSTSDSPDLQHLAAWWRLRGALVHNRLLDEPVPFGDSIMRGPEGASEFLLERKNNSSLSHPPKAKLWTDVLARLVLERGLALQRGGSGHSHGQDAGQSPGRNQTPSELFVEAARLHGFAYQLSGALGKRTKWQKEDKSQLILLAKSRDDVIQSEAEERAREAQEAKEANDAAVAEEQGVDHERSGWKSRSKEGQDKSMPSNLELNDDTLLELTQFTSTVISTDGGEDAASPLAAIDPNAQPPLSPFDQSILLALSLNIRNTSPSHGLTSSQISAFVQRVLLHPMNWSVYTMALLLRSRLESTRTRTVERSVLQLQALVDQMPTADSSVSERLRFFFSIDLPPRWELQAELGKRYAALGVVRSALEIYSAIEMWEEAVLCLGSLGRHEEGREVVRDLLEGRKVEVGEALVRRKQMEQSEGVSGTSKGTARTRMGAARLAKLWCLLGDLEPASALEHYKQAWSVSGSSSARAARSLGGIYFSSQQYAQTIDWLRRALAINPLFSRSWFVLGCAYMREESWQLAAGCFRRCTSLDDEDGESWNNLASCYLRMGVEGGSKKGGVRKRRAQDASKVTNGTALPLLDEEANDGLDALTLEDENDTEDDEEDEPSRVSSARKADTSYALRKLAHRALEQSLKFSRDSWRVWYNYMVVSIDVGELREAARALGRVVEIRCARSAADAGEKGGADAVDFDVLDRLVDAVTRGGASSAVVTDGAGAAQGYAQAQEQEDPNAARNLLRAIELLFSGTLLARVHDSARLWRVYARLQMYKGAYRAYLEAELQAWKCARADAGEDAAALDKARWLQGVEELQELVEVMENLGPRPAKVRGPLALTQEGGSKEDEEAEEAMPDWKFKARSLVRGYMARTKEAFEDAPEWDRLVQMRNGLRGA